MIDIEEFIELFNSETKGNDNINIFEFTKSFRNSTSSKIQLYVVTVLGKV